MAEEKKRGGHDTLMMEEREKLQIGGVLEVISFDEEGVMMETTCGLLVLKGAELHIGKLDLEEGEVTVNGTIDSIDYSDGSAVGDRTHPLLGKLFR